MLANLIPLRGRLSGPQYAGWTPSQVAQQGLGCRLLADVRIPMPDGVNLSADVYLPRKKGRYPAVVCFSAYNKDLHSTGAPTGTNEVGSPPVFTGRGYAHILVPRRGAGRSEGMGGLWFNEQDQHDHAAVIEWAARQPWCDGNVVLFGTSYYGMSQPLVAVLQPPSLKAFFASEICTDYYRHLYRYGATGNCDFLSLWNGVNFPETVVRRRVPPLVRALLSHVLNRPWVWKVARPRVAQIFAAAKKSRPRGEELGFYRQLLFDSLTRAEHPGSLGPSGQLGRVQVPFVVIQPQSQWNLHQFGAYDLFQNAGSARRWLIIGAAEYELPAYSFQLEALAFFDHLVKGLDNGYDAQPRVRAELGQSWLSGTDFPFPQARRKRYYLGTGPLRDEPCEGRASWLAAPRSAELLPGLEHEQQLAWSLEFREPTTLAGPLKVNLRFSCNEIDSHVVARLGRQSPGGKDELLALGHLRPAQRLIDEERSTRAEVAHLDQRVPLVPHEPVELTFSLTPAVARFEAGDRLTFKLGSRTEPFIGQIADGHVNFNFEVPPYFSRNTVHFGQGSWLEADFV